MDVLVTKLRREGLKLFSGSIEGEKRDLLLYFMLPGKKASRRPRPADLFSREFWRSRTVHPFARRFWSVPLQGKQYAKIQSKHTSAVARRIRLDLRRMHGYQIDVTTRPVEDGRTRGAVPLLVALSARGRAGQTALENIHAVLSKTAARRASDEELGGYADMRELPSRLEWHLLPPLHPPATRR